MILFALYFLLCLVYLFLPLFGGIFLLIFSLRFKKYLSVTLLFVSFSFSLLAFCADSSGLISTDLERYRAQYLTYVGSPFGWLFSVNIIFDSITWLFANYVSDNVRFVGMIWVFISNIFLMFSVRKLLEYFIPYNWGVYLICYISVFLIIPLAMQNELLKQVSVFAIVLYILVRNLDLKKMDVLSLCLSAIALFIHPATALCLLPLCFFKNMWFQKKIALFLLISLVMSQIDILSLAMRIPLPDFLDNLLGLQEKIQAYSNFSDWGGSRRFYIVLLFYGFVVFNLRSFINDEKYRNAVMALIIMLCILLINMSSNHNFARLTNTLYPFFIMAFIISVAVMKVRGLFYYLFVLAALVLSNVIQYNSNMHNSYYLTYMHNDIVCLFTSTVFDYLNYQ